MSFPENAIRWLLKDAGLRLRDITHVAIARQPDANLAAKAEYVLINPRIGLEAVSRFTSRQTGTAKTLNNLAEICGEEPSLVNYKLHTVEHYLAHIASAYYLSPFEKITAGFSYDGSGDFASAMAARCEGNRIEVLDKVTVPNSLRHFYTAMCQFIGFDLFGEEYKVMGLAPYGADKYAEEMAKVVELETGKWFQLNSKYFTISRGFSEAQLSDDQRMKLGRIFSDKLTELLGEPRDRSSALTH